MRAVDRPLAQGMPPIDPCVMRDKLQIPADLRTDSSPRAHAQRTAAHDSKTG